jgi:hypothetical protein
VLPRRLLEPAVCAPPLPPLPELAPEAAPAASAADAMISPVLTGEPYEIRVMQLEMRVVQLERLLNPGRGIKRDMVSSE